MLAVLALAGGLVAVILVTIGVVEWVRGATFDLESIARMGVFMGLLAMGTTQFLAARRWEGVRTRPVLAASIWTLAWALTYLAVVV